MEACFNFKYYNNYEEDWNIGYFCSVRQAFLETTPGSVLMASCWWESKEQCTGGAGDWTRVYAMQGILTPVFTPNYFWIFYTENRSIVSMDI